MSGAERPRSGCELRTRIVRYTDELDGTTNGVQFVESTFDEASGEIVTLLGKVPYEMASVRRPEPGEDLWATVEGLDGAEDDRVPVPVERVWSGSEGPYAVRGADPRAT